MMDEKDIQREHVITDTDIRNIEKRRGLKFSRKDDIDSVSVSLWAKNLAPIPLFSTTKMLKVNRLL